MSAWTPPCNTESFARGEGDRYSDLDCQLYFQEEALAEVDQLAWISQIAQVGLYYVNEFGVGAAVFENLVRGEFHFDPVSAMQKLPSLQGALWFPLSRMPSCSTGMGRSPATSNH